jgi:chromosomal replication initiator protein
MMRSPRRTTARPSPATAPASSDAIAAALVRHIGHERYDQWFAQRTHISIDTSHVTIFVPNRFVQDRLTKTFGKAISAAVEEAFGEPRPVRFEIDPELMRGESKSAGDEAVAPHPSARPAQFAEPPPKGLYDSPKPRQELLRRETRKSSRRWRRLDDFVVGACNRVALAASLHAVEAPGQGPSPLVIHGPVGTGKTHLLEGIYVGLRQHAPDWKVTFATAEDFTNRFTQAIRHGQMAQFRKQFRECDALLLDDLHRLAGRQRTQEEFLHTFDALASGGKPVVVTCDCHPRLTDDFVPELADRLVGGAVWGLQPPDAPTRLDLLKSKTAKAHAAVAEEVLQFLADQLRGNVRELEGALNSLRHFSRVTGRAIDIALAREALGDLLRHAVRIVRLEDIDAAVCRALRLAPGALQSNVRTWAVSHPRMIAIYLARKHTSASYSEVGLHFGGRNHSTAVAAEKKVRQWLATGEELATDERPRRVQEIIERVERDLGR